jgi:hypothetical protein
VTSSRRGPAGFGDEAVEDLGPVQEACEPVADERLQAVEGDNGEVGQTAF